MFVEKQRNCRAKIIFKKEDEELTQWFQDLSYKARQCGTVKEEIHRSMQNQKSVTLLYQKWTDPASRTSVRM